MWQLPEMVDLSDDEATSRVVRELVAAAGLAPVDASVRWTELGSAPERLLLWPFRFSMAYGTRSTMELSEARSLARSFFAAVGEPARHFTLLDGSAFLDEEGETPKKGGFSYGTMGQVTAATFEVCVVSVGYERVGLFVATDED